MSFLRSPNRVRSPFLRAADDLRKNDAQWRVYESNGHCVVLAGPGSGKTKVLTVKLARMLAEDVRHPRGVACVTYSSECARELTRRLQRLGVRATSNLFIGTVHSFCLKNIVIPFARMAGEEIVDPIVVASSSEQDRMLQRALSLEISANERLSTWGPRCSKYRTSHLDRNSSEWREKDEETARVIERYEKLLHDQGMIDFEDMVLIGLRLVESHRWIRQILQARFPILAVDEYQDLGLPLHRLVMTLCLGEAPNSRLLAVGDTDQSIYGFTGAHPELLSQLAEDERVEGVRLRLNYRSRSEIVSASEHALGEKRGYEAASGEGGIIDFVKCPKGLEQQAEKICEELIPKALATEAARHLGEIAVLYPTKDVGDVIAEAVSKAGLNCIRIDKNAPYPKTPFTRWLEECTAWCAGGWESGEPMLSDLVERWFGFNSASRSEDDRRQLRRALVSFLFSQRDPSMSLGQWLKLFLVDSLQDTFNRNTILRDEQEVFGKTMAACESGKPLSQWSIAQFGGQMGSRDHLKLITLHSAKGLEFDVVFMMGLDQGKIPWANLSADAKREPRRLFYVGLTRARNEVNLLFSGWIQTKYGRKSFGPASEFVVEVWKRLHDTSD